MPVSLPNGPKSDAARWLETGRRLDILTGNWASHLREAARRRFGAKRAKAVGRLDESQNQLEFLCRELSCLYQLDPVVFHALLGPEDLQAFRNDLKFSGLWGLLSQVQFFTLGLREMLVRCDAEQYMAGETERVSLVFRAVFPHRVWVRCLPSDPSQPVELKEWRERQGPNGLAWYIDHFSVDESAGGPFYRVLDADNNDVTETFLRDDPEWVAPEGAAYPYRDGIGRPFLPYVAYHATPTAGEFWQSNRGKEAVNATLTLAVMDGFVVHCFHAAAFPQRYGINVRVAGGDDQGEAGTEIEADPAMILMLESLAAEEGGGIVSSVGQWQIAADPEMLQRVLDRRAAALAAHFGVQPMDLLRTSKTAQSGEALALTGEGKREAQRRYGHFFADYDTRLLRVAACTLNRFRPGTNLPEVAWSIRYTELPLSPEERRVRLEEVKERRAMGLMSRLDAFMYLNPGITRAEAETLLGDIDNEGGENG